MNSGVFLDILRNKKDLEKTQDLKKVLKIAQFCLKICKNGSKCRKTFWPTSLELDGFEPVTSSFRRKIAFFATKRLSSFSCFFGVSLLFPKTFCFRKTFSGTLYIVLGKSEVISPNEKRQALPLVLFRLELLTRFELVTSSLPRTCSTCWAIAAFSFASELYNTIYKKFFQPFSCHF